MKYLAIVILLLAATLSFGQCSADPVQGTNCAGPIKTTVKPGQSPTSFTDFYPATVQWPCLKAPTGFFRLCATGGYVAVDLGDGQGYLNLRGRDGVDGKDGINGVDGKSATVTVGSVSSGTLASAWNSGTPLNAVLNFVFQKGDQGVPGLIVGNTVIGDIVCPKGRGTIPSSWATLGCSFKITAITVIH